MPDYKPLSLSGTFIIVKTSDSSPIGESDDNNNDNDDVQYSIRGTPRTEVHTVLLLLAIMIVMVLPEKR